MHADIVPCGGILSSRSSRQEPRMYSLIAKAGEAAQKRRPCAQGSRACVRNKHPKGLPVPHVGSMTVEKSLPWRDLPRTFASFSSLTWKQTRT